MRETGLKRQNVQTFPGSSTKTTRIDEYIFHVCTAQEAVHTLKSIFSMSRTSVHLCIVQKAAQHVLIL